MALSRSFTAAAQRWRPVAPHELESLERRALLSLPWATVPPPSSVPETVGGSSIAADFDSDGRIDLAVSDERTLRFLKGNGDGTFQAATGLTLAADIGEIVVGRIDGDSRPDLASVVVMQGRKLLTRVFYFDPASGSFTVGARRSVDSGLARQAYLDATLLVGNTYAGWRDELVVLYRGTLYEQRAVTRTRLASVSSRTLPSDASDFRLADLEGDGVEDLVFLTGASSGAVTTLSTFSLHGSSTYQRTLYATSRIQTFGIADMTGDGVPDILLTESTFLTADPPTLTLLSGGGSFGSFASRTTWAWPDALRMENGGQIAAIQDVNGDGRMDVLFRSYNESGYYYSTDVESALVVVTRRSDGGWDADTGFTAEAHGYFGSTYPTISQNRFQLAALSGNSPDLLDRAYYDGQLTRAANTAPAGPVRLLGGGFSLYPDHSPAVAFIARVSVAGASSDFGGSVRRVEVIYDANDNGVIDADEIVAGTADGSTVSGNVFRVTAILPSGAAPGTTLHLLARAVALDGTYSDGVDLGSVMLPA